MTKPTNDRSASKAFSLIELVIVIVILAAIAAIAVPRIGRGSVAAGEAALRSDLTLLRKAIELYAVEHQNVHPGAVSPDGSCGAAGTEEAFQRQLVEYTNSFGGCSSVKDTDHPFGPYLVSIPPLPVGQNAGMKSVSTSNNGPMAAVEDRTGWVYNYDSGEIIPNADEMDSSSNTSYEQY